MVVNQLYFYFVFMDFFWYLFKNFKILKCIFLMLYVIFWKIYFLYLIYLLFVFVGYNNYIYKVTKFQDSFCQFNYILCNILFNMFSFWIVGLRIRKCMLEGND